MFYFLKTLVLISLIFVISCNKNLTEEEKKELWSKAQTTGEIINRSGTVFNPGVNKELALRDAETRLQTGGGLFGKKFLSLGNEKKDGANISSTRIGMPLNQHLWQASLEVLDFIPLSSADPIGGVIITDWHTTEANEDERCKLNVFIKGVELQTQNLKVSSFCQIFKNNKWVSIESVDDNNIKLENAILNKAKKLRLGTG